MRFWISWDTAAWAAFIGWGPWWVIGETRGEVNRSTMVCAIVADDEKDAQQKILHLYDPRHDAAEEVKWRSCEAREDDWEPFCDRFPRLDWMQWPSDGSPPEKA